MKKPNFFIIGAPKCGTTALAHWLTQHPEVFFAPRKEPHFFNTDGLVRTYSLSAYETLFDNASPGCRAVGEGSTRYLYSRTAVSNILEYAPSARFIVCLRNPLEMAPALHGEMLSHGQESERNFEKAWRLQAKRAQRHNLPITMTSVPSLLLYGELCLLGKQLQRLYSIVPREQVHTVILDDIRAAPDTEYKRVLAFLGVSEENAVDFKPVNTAKHTRSVTLAIAIQQFMDIKQRLGIEMSFGIAGALKKRNVSGAARKELAPALKSELKEYFQSDIHLLSKLIERNLAEWLK